jgi:hypothetical protein
MFNFQKIGHPIWATLWGRFFKKNGQSTFNFLSKIMVIINKNGQSNFFKRIL